MAGPVGPALVRMAVPMAVGILVITLFIVTDTYFVSLLGTPELAALSFAAPVCFTLLGFISGLGIGASGLLARLIGANKPDQVHRLSLSALLLGGGAAVLLGGLGIASIEPLFRALGAEPAIIDLVRDYLLPWYAGLGLLALLIMANSAIRASGDTKTPAVLMAVAGVANVVLDPLLIFGLGPLPGFGLAGAAIASVLAWGIACVMAVWVLLRRMGRINWGALHLSQLGADWRRILYMGLPTAATSMLLPLALGVMTAMVAEFGAEAVAAFGVGGRLEGLIMVPQAALSASLSPFIGQNYGAGQTQRVEQALRLSIRFTWWSQGLLYLVLLLGASTLAHLFSDDPRVVDLTILFLLIMPLSYIAQGILLLLSSALIALHLPLQSMLVNLLRAFALSIPLAWLGAQWGGVQGLWWGMVAANWLALALVYLWFRWRWPLLARDPVTAH